MDKKRSRVVSFRLSQEEYEALKILSESYGARSISEFTRLAACQSGSVNIVSAESEKLDNALENLNNAIGTLSQHVQSIGQILDTSDRSEENDES